LLAGSTAEGFLFAGLRLDDGYARALSQASGLDVLLLSESAVDAPLLASSLDPQLAAQIAKRIVGSRTAQGDDQAGSIRIAAEIAPGAQDSSATLYPLFGAANQPLRLAFLLPDQSPSHQRAIWQPLLIPLAVIALLGVLAAVLSWRGLLRPIALLPGLLSAAGAGDVHRIMPVEGGRLARTIALGFNRLMAALQQRLASIEPANSAAPESPNETDQT
jgi:hypothetical protein